MALGSAQSLTAMGTRNISCGERRPVLVTDNLTWPIQVCTGVTSRLIFTHVFRNAGQDTMPKRTVKAVTNSIILKIT
jgi:hypothetical protein